MLPQSHSHPHHFSTSPSSTQTSYYYPEDNFNTSPSIYHPDPPQVYPPTKRGKVYPSFDFTEIPSTFDCPPLVYSSVMPRAVPLQRNIAPQINFHQASEPASPVTIATTLSTHSSPSPSPAITIVSDHHNPIDFPLYDESYPLKEHQLNKQHTPRPHFGANTSNPSPTFHNSLAAELDSSWPLCIAYAKLHQQQQHQQQYYQNSIPIFHHADDEDMPDLSPSRCSASRPSISEVDMPATPGHSPVDRAASRCAQAPAAREHAFIADWIDGCLPLQLEHHTGPKLMRTVSDAEQDELFNPGIAPGTTHSQPDRISDTNSRLPTLLQQAQSQHLARSTPVKPTMMVRGHSAFRANSPFYPARAQQEIIPSPTGTTAFLNIGAYNTARSQRAKDIERDAEALRQQLQRGGYEEQQTPKTISPKDAYIEYAEPENNGIQGRSLFSSNQNDDAYSQRSIKSESDDDSCHGDDDNEQSYDNSLAPGSRRDSDVNMDYGMPIYHHHNAQQQQFGDHLNIPGYGGWGDESPSQESEASRLSDSNCELTSSPLRKPADIMANDGAYSCTVHGCTLRFPTASKMSKHRRESHRNNTPSGRDAPIKSLLQGPSRCERFNPATGKLCNTIFSRPYDLTRHEDTIHNTARQKVRCEICDDEKTFSRHDALTRHKKVRSSLMQTPKS